MSADDGNAERVDAEPKLIGRVNYRGLFRWLGSVGARGGRGTEGLTGSLDGGTLEAGRSGALPAGGIAS